LPDLADPPTAIVTANDEQALTSDVLKPTDL